VILKSFVSGNVIEFELCIYFVNKGSDAASVVACLNRYSVKNGVLGDGDRTAVKSTGSRRAGAVKSIVDGSACSSGGKSNGLAGNDLGTACNACGGSFAGVCIYAACAAVVRIVVMYSALASEAVIDVANAAVNLGGVMYCAEVCTGGNTCVGVTGDAGRAVVCLAGSAVELAHIVESAVVGGSGSAVAVVRHTAVAEIYLADRAVKLISVVNGAVVGVGNYAADTVVVVVGNTAGAVVCLAGSTVKLGYIVNCAVVGGGSAGMIMVRQAEIADVCIAACAELSVLSVNCTVVCGAQMRMVGKACRADVRIAGLAVLLILTVDRAVICGGSGRMAVVCTGALRAVVSAAERAVYVVTSVNRAVKISGQRSGVRMVAAVAGGAVVCLACCTVGACYLMNRAGISGGLSVMIVMLIAVACDAVVYAADVAVTLADLVLIAEMRRGYRTTDTVAVNHACSAVPVAANRTVSIGETAYRADTVAETVIVIIDVAGIVNDTLGIKSTLNSKLGVNVEACTGKYYYCNSLGNGGSGGNVCGGGNDNGGRAAVNFLLKCRICSRYAHRNESYKHHYSKYGSKNSCFHLSLLLVFIVKIIHNRYFHTVTLL